MSEFLAIIFILFTVILFLTLLAVWQIKMAGMKEFKARIESDATFAKKFAGIEDEKQIIALARAEGYDLEQLSEKELNAVAGGAGSVLDEIREKLKRIGEVFK